MISRTSVVSALLALIAIAPSLSAQSITGRYDLSGRQGRRAVTAELTVSTTPTGFRVTRAGAFSTQRFAHLPGFNWSAPVTRTGSRTFRARYEVGSAPSNLIEATYTLSSDGQTLSEELRNLTRYGSEGYWRTGSTSGGLLAGASLADKARARAMDLPGFVMDYFTDVADYYEPGDEQLYRDDLDELEDYFRGADFVEVALPQLIKDNASGPRPPVTAFVAQNAAGPEYRLEDGEVMVLFDADGRVYGYAFVWPDYVYTSDQDIWDTTPTPTPTPPAPVTCPPGTGASEAQLQVVAQGMDHELTSFIMDFRTSIADYYDWGDQAYYDADERSAERYFQGATWSRVAVPAGYSAYMALGSSNADPDDVILGQIVLLFDCAGKVTQIVYLSEGDVYDDDDL